MRGLAAVSVDGKEAPRAVTGSTHTSGSKRQSLVVRAVAPSSRLPVLYLQDPGQPCERQVRTLRLGCWPLPLPRVLAWTPMVPHPTPQHPLVGVLCPVMCPHCLDCWHSAWAANAAPTVTADVPDTGDQVTITQSDRTTEPPGLLSPPEFSPWAFSPGVTWSENNIFLLLKKQ